MSEAMTSLLTVQEKIRDRILNDFAELIPQDAVGEMVQRAINDAFFRDRYIEEGNAFNKRTIKKQPLLVEMAEKEALAIFEKAVKQWIAENEDKVMASLREVFEKSAGEVLLRAMGQIFSQTIEQVQYGIVNQVQGIVKVNDLKVQQNY